MFDIAIITMVAIAFIRGYMKGLIAEVAGIVALILGVGAAARFSPMTQEVLTPLLGDNSSRLVAFAVTLVVVVIAVHVIAKFAQKIAGMMALSVPNKLLGGLFRVARILIIVSCVLGVINRLLPSGCILSDEQREASVSYGFVCSFADFVFPYIEQGIEIVNQNKDALNLDK